MDARMRREGYRLFLHSPNAIRPDRPCVPGFLFECGAFRAIEASMPAVNGNWTHRTRRLLESGMGYAPFLEWAEQHDIGIYVPYVFSELLADKLETYKLVHAYHETLHPCCEAWSGRVRQLEYFVEMNPLTFVKPRNGNKGNRIVAIHREDRGLRLVLYDEGRRRRVQAASLKEVLVFLHDFTRGPRKYVIQHGIETVRHAGSTFDIRVTMVNDGEAWQCLHEARIAPRGSDVSNVRQGGDIAVTEALLFEAVGSEVSTDILDELRNESFGLVAHLERLHPGDVHEVAFDFAVDPQGSLRLLEINTKPGLAGIGSNVSVYDLRPEDERMFEGWARPHVNALADFLIRRARRFAVAH
jgi:hypothetical protein